MNSSPSDARQGNWRAADDDDALRKRALPEGLSVLLTIEGRDVVVNAPTDPNDSTPQIMIFSNGDLTSFEIKLAREGGTVSNRLLVDDDGKLTSDAERARQPGSEHSAARGRVVRVRSPRPRRGFYVDRGSGRTRHCGWSASRAAVDVEFCCQQHRVSARQDVRAVGWVQPDCDDPPRLAGACRWHPRTATSIMAAASGITSKRSPSCNSLACVGSMSTSYWWKRARRRPRITGPRT